MRYTTARPAKFGEYMLNDLYKDTVNFVPNYDGEEVEPELLPSLLCNALLNGTKGIAVGMGASFPSQNIKDVYNCLFYIIDQSIKNEEVDINELIRLIQAPDFATGGITIIDNNLIEGYKTGKGKCYIRSKYHIEDNNIIIDEIPYDVNKQKLVENIKILSKDRIGKNKQKIPAAITGIKDVRDESDKNGIRICIELKNGANSETIINNLIKRRIDFQKSFSINMIAMKNGIPKQYNLYEVFNEFMGHAIDVFMRKSQYMLNKLTKRINVLKGIIHCFNDYDEDNNLIIDRVYTILRESDNPQEEMTNLGFNKEQIEYILEQKLRSLMKTNIEKIQKEYDDNLKEYDYNEKVLNDVPFMLQELKKQFQIIVDKFGDDRRTEIVENFNTVTDMDLIKDEMLVITYTTDHIIKAVSEKEYKTQRRGGKGIKGTETKTDEAIRFMFTCSNKHDLLFFTNNGKCYPLKAFKIDKSSRTAKGKSIQNYLSLSEGEKIINVVCADLTDKESYLLFITKLGMIKKLAVDQLSERFAYTKVISFKTEEDTLIQALLVKDENVIIITNNGLSVKIKSTDIRSMGRQASGVRAMKITDNEVIDMAIVTENSSILTITENGYGKKTPESEWRENSRGCKGVKCHKITDKTGNIMAVLTPKDNDELLIATKNGLIVKIDTEQIKNYGKTASGVKLISLNEGDKVVSVSLQTKQEIGLTENTENE